MPRYRPFRDITSDTPDSRVRSAAQKLAVLDALHLYDIRVARGADRDTLNSAFEAARNETTAEERAEDLYLARLRAYIVALGGQMRVSAVLDGEEIPLAVLEKHGAASRRDHDV